MSQIYFRFYQNFEDNLIFFFKTFCTRLHRVNSRGRITLYVEITDNNAISKKKQQFSPYFVSPNTMDVKCKICRIYNVNK